MNKKLIRLTESDLHNIIMESVNKILGEGLAQTDIDWISLIKNGMKEGKISMGRGIGDIPFNDIIEYGEANGYINGNVWQIIRNERENILTAYSMCNNGMQK